MRYDIRNLRLMIVDDQKTMRTIIRRILDQIGISDVTEANSGDQALAFVPG